MGAVIPLHKTLSDPSDGSDRSDGSDTPIRPAPAVQAKSLLIWRIGGIGDLLWCTTALPVLARQGWTIDFCTDAGGRMVLAHNPHVRRLIPWEDQRTPDGEDMSDPSNRQNLNRFRTEAWWGALSKGYERAVPLTWSVEGVALWRQRDHPIEYALPLAERQTDLHYTDEIVRRLAMPVGGLLPQLYTCKAERRWLDDLRALHRGKRQRILLWHVGGSCYNKILPQAPQYIGGLLKEIPDLYIYLLGDDRLRLFEAALVTLPDLDKSRVASVRSRWDLRHQMLACSIADCVVGPESAIVNAAACWDVPKVIFYSHSRHENLGLYWWNAYPIYPTAQCECTPCYRIIVDDPEDCRVYERDLDWVPTSDGSDKSDASDRSDPSDRGKPVGAKCCVYLDHGEIFQTIGSILQGRPDRTCPVCGKKKNRLLDPGVYGCICGARFGIPRLPARPAIPRPLLRCPVCGDETDERLDQVPGAIGWARCRCGVIFHRAEELDPSLYNEIYTKKYDDPQYRTKIRAVGERWLPTIEKLVSDRSDSSDGSDRSDRKLLEIGYCWPENLWLARERGWDIAGCEINPTAPRDFPVIGTDFEACELDGQRGTFDCVFSNHVFEHFNNPLKALQLMTDLVRPGGVIFLGTPDAENRNVGAHLHRGEHYVLWSAAALGAAAMRLGLEVVEVEKHDGPECGFISWYDFHMLLRKPGQTGLTRPTGQTESSQ